MGITYRIVQKFEGGKFPTPWMYNLSLACNHCANPRCVKNCPSGALSKREKDGIVLLNKEKCLGCQSCVRFCPYGAPRYFAEERKAGKCDFCVDYLDNLEEPACVAACPMRALRFGPIKNF